MPVLALGAGCARGGDRVPGAGARVPVWAVAVRLGGRIFCSPDSDIYGVLITSTDNEVAVLWCWCWVLWKQGASAGCWCPVLVRAVALVLGAVSWLCAGWRHGTGAGCWCWAP